MKSDEVKALIAKSADAASKDLPDQALQYATAAATIANALLMLASLKEGGHIKE